MTRRRTLIRAGLFLGAATLATLWATGTLPYLLRLGRFQAEMLWGRVPIDQVLGTGRFTAAQEERLRQVPRIKAFGARIGLSATANYDEINPTWQHTIWNVSACEAVGFRNQTWWFPIVGTVPYLGFFDRGEAEVEARRLRATGADVYVRTAGAYSTLGWFRDPLLPKMLDWNEATLAETILHELAHATLWIPGSVSFNESFANFVGQEAARRYLIDTYGPDGAPTREAAEREHDAQVYRKLMHDLYQELDALYRDPARTRDEKLRIKSQIFAALPARALTAGFSNPSRQARLLARSDWNNARLAQFRTYNETPERFARLLDQENGDLIAFIERMRELGASGDAQAALTEAAAR